MKRTCNTCGLEKDLVIEFFSPMKECRGGFRPSCRMCVNKAALVYYHSNPEYKNRQAQYRKSPHSRKITRERNASIRRKLLEAYGHKCQCCGETEACFLALDHINGGGNEERKTLGKGTTFFQKLRKLGFPRDNYQLLCHNCNMAKGLYGICPHQENE